MSSATANKNAGRSSVSSSNGQGVTNVPATAFERRLLSALRSFKSGDFSVRLPVNGTGIGAEIAQAFNECLETKTRMLGEVKRVSRGISRDGRLSQRATLDNATGGWQEHIEAYNSLLETVATPISETNRVLAAVARGRPHASDDHRGRRASPARGLLEVGAGHQRDGRPAECLRL